MTRSTSKSVSTSVGLNSFKGYYLLGAVCFIVYFLGLAWYTQYILGEASTSTSINSARHANVKMLIKKITTDIWTIEHTLQSYTWAPEQSRRDIILGTIESIQEKIPRIMSAQWMRQSSQVKNAILPLELNLSRLETEIIKFMDIRIDIFQRYPVTRQFVEVMLPANTAFTTAVMIAEDEAEEHFRTNASHYPVLKTYKDIRLAWSQMIGAFRVFVTSRFGMFANDTLNNTLGENFNVTIYMDQVKQLTSKLDQFNGNNELELQEIDSLEKMHEESKKWFYSYRKTSTVIESSNWRADVPLLKNSIQPIFVNIWKNLSELEHFIDNAALAEIEIYAADVNKKSNQLSLLMLLSLVFVIIGYQYFNTMIRKPIAQLTDILKDRISRQTSKPILLDSNLKETNNLVDVFNLMYRKQIDNQTRLETILENAAESIITIDEQGVVQGYNKAAEELFGYMSENVIGKNLSMLVPLRERDNHEKFLSLSKTRGSLKVTNEKRELVAQHQDGQLIPISLKLSETMIEGERLYIGLVSDISEQKAILDDIQYIAKYDEVTGLFNRNYFRTELMSALENTRSNKECEYALLYIDLDNFNYVNDTLGYTAGDLLLKEVASVVNNGTRKEDIVARFGGDVFTVLLEKTNADLAQKIAQIIHRKISEIIFTFKGVTISIHSSIGVSFIFSTLELDEVMSHADSACHRAKMNGKNRIYIYDRKIKADRATMSLDLGWSQRIKSAIENDQFALAYQPIVNTVSNEAESYEILIRMIGENNKIIMPNDFLPSAERYGLAAAIDKWVVTKAMSVLVEMRKLTPQLRFTVNLSGQTFSDRSICDVIRDSIRENGLEPSALTFEVTETIAISDMRAAESILTEIRQMGCKTALDDFGSGMSSFAYLKDLPVDIVKIDGQFVKNLATNLVDQAMVKAMNEVAQVLDKQTVAEFVEDKESFKLLGQLGVNYGQGYYLGKPEIIFPYQLSNKVSKLKSS